MPSQARNHPQIVPKSQIFSKPTAEVKIVVVRIETPQDSSTPTGGTVITAAATADGVTPLHFVIAWEYWNGRQWYTLFQTTDEDKTGLFKELNTPVIIDLTVPDDMVTIKVNDQDGLWMRARLVSGGFGFTQDIPLINGGNNFKVIIPQPPALSDFRVGYTWQHGPFYPEHVLTYNDFQYEDRTVETKLPGQTFQPFKPVGDVTPALYLGFDKALPVDRLGIYFDIMEQRGDTLGPALLWQYWDGIAWQNLFVEDETRNFRLPGIAALIGPEESQPLARFDVPLHWLRAGLKEDRPPGAPTVNGIFPNAVWADQHQTIADEPMGASTGQSNQTFAFRQIPVLAGERIEVREVAGLRANVEWRIVAMELFGGDARVIQEIEAMLGAEGAQTDIEQGDLRLKHDRNKRVTEVWVRWQSQKDLFFSGPADRHYIVERARGSLLFGDGDRGKIPPAGAAILARQYRAGGGLAGNVPARAISQVLGPIGGIESTFNPSPAEGGADSETLERYSLRAPQTLRHRGRAIAPRDYETLAREASAAVAFARAIPTRDPSGRPIPGWVTVLIIPQSQEPRPWPSFGLREEVQKFIEARAPADLAAAEHIYVTGPDYQPIDVEATIVPLDPAEAGAVEQSARTALERFLHPIQGGPEGRGWELGRDVFVSDVASVLERVEGVDYVKELALLLNGVLQGERVKVAVDRIVVAGDIRLKLIEG